MHELSIAQSILDIAQKEMNKAQAATIQELELEIGTLAGIEYESLNFALQALISGTLLENMRIILLKPEGKATCLDCQEDFGAAGFIISCPKCRSFNCRITGGKEFKVKSIVI